MRHEIAYLTYMGAAIILGVPPAAADDCTCKGALENTYRGGDKSRLYWTFETFVDTPANAFQDILICYHKKLENNSAIEIRNIRWEPADYYPPPMPAGSVSSACPTLPGIMNISTKSGPLYFGISSRGLDTTVREPKAGWKARSVNSVIGSGFQVAQVSPPINDENQKLDDAKEGSAVTYPDVHSEFNNSNFKISILSQARTEASLTHISLQVENKGDLPIRISSSNYFSSYIPPNSFTKQVRSYPKFIAKVGVASFRVGGLLAPLFSPGEFTAGVYLEPNPNERRGATQF